MSDTTPKKRKVIAEGRSPKKRRTVKTDKPEPEPEEDWRESVVPEDAKITKTDALDLYRLKAEDLRGLHYVPDVNLMGLKYYLYKERDVERKAWAKHGGPKCFEAYLSKLQKTFEANARHRGMLFKRPSFYASNFTAGPSQSNAPPALDPLLSLSAKFPPWLWTACTNALDSLEDDPENDIRFTTTSRQACLNCALKQLPTYPSRPSATLGLSPTLERLRSVLAEAPSRDSPKGKDGYPEGLRLNETDYIDGETFWEWTESYRDRVFGALIALIEERGVGENGWESVRWEVYDKHSECLEPISYQPPSEGYKSGLWKDYAYTWLLGKTPADHSTTFGVWPGRASEVGRRYDELLPDNVEEWGGRYPRLKVV
ncbi:uncharacterized protein STEHIDRAFT_125305 [Stereum hirsutum FP-91666 SS1]|uniref:uncharacterized protein n=1 Tax=Stereum hirsutum (strain FP-91666) TaxID=721885 RepID=UPI000444934C|nr:uncharacterized protein STEHIDRAFT_125305 [Stereum hirsutum FP-91666 SS1]EIM81002.1 hypothetical protein STEHIDRAFT_125305 [Stereum hirsutum FP-91666 SS1]